MKNKVYKITNIEELTTCIDKENLHRFMEDFYKMMIELTNIKDQTEDDLKKNIFIDRITWIDDGVNDVTLKLNNI